ncbi:MAG TPA: hypothetical protein PK447_03275, partial [Ignavibacteria bacterium]|nr:hypothetical protein [Ignavibacteria bacterium]
FIIIDNFFKTKENILAGSKAFIMFMGKKEKSYLLKGFVKYEKQAIYFENKILEYHIRYSFSPSDNIQIKIIFCRKNRI